MIKNEFNGSEKRRFKRHVFKSDDEVMGFFEFPKISADLRSYQIADISASGLRFFISRDSDHPIDTDDRFTLKKMMGKLQLAFVTDIDLKVQWVVDHDMFGHIAVGCQFIDISETDQAHINRFVNYEAIGKRLNDE